MKFILDANIPYSAAAIFSAGEAVHVRNIGLGTASDAEIAKYALKEKAVLITRDLDFANIILHQPVTHHGVVVLRVPSYFTAKHIISLMKVFFLKVTRESLIQRLTILEPGRYRTRGK